jgi:hypothetical protein
MTQEVFRFQTKVTRRTAFPTRRPRVNPSLVLSALSVHLRRSFARLLLALLPVFCLLPSPLAQAQTGAGTQAAARSETDARPLKMGELVERNWRVASSTLIKSH